jgi:DUF4097 and DUF4098 domain-containing protein YvlB
MRKLVITIVGIFSIITILLIGFMISIINKGGINLTFETSNLTLVNTQNIKINDTESLNIKYRSEDIYFYEHDSDELILKEYMNIEPDLDQLTNIDKNGTQLIIQGSYKNSQSWFFNQGYYGKIEIYLPTNYSEQLAVSTSSGVIVSDFVFELSSLDATSSSGDIKLNEIYAERINLSASSGNINVTKAEGTRNLSSSSGDIKVLSGSGELDIESSSGTITVQNNSSYLEAESSSGDIKIISSDGEKDIETTSGCITIKDSSGYIDANASSGDVLISNMTNGGSFNTTSGCITLEFAKEVSSLLEDIEINASSGDVNLKLPTSFEFNFSASTSSGDIRTFFDDQLAFNKKQNQASGAIGNTNERNIDINTTSGSITIKKR